MQRMWKQSPQTVSIRHTFTHKKPRYQKLHGAMGEGAAAPWIRHCLDLLHVRTRYEKVIAWWSNRW